MKRVLPLFIATLFILVIFGSLVVNEANAASLGNVKDVITTSRPSAASPVTNSTPGAAASSGSINIANNGSRYLASDSATVIRTSTGNAIMSGLNVASQSAALTTVYLGTTTSTLAQLGTDVLIVPITARHTVSFSTISPVPTGGHIYITFPGTNVNAASPSATAFAWNNLQNANVTAAFSSGSATCNFTATAAGVVDCLVATANVGAGITVTITIGSSTPTLINPTKSAAAGTADTWKIFLRTTDGANDLDSGSAKIATIESVQVQATVEPTLTFTISGIPNNINLNTDGTWGLGSCGAIITNAGIDATPTSVNLGILGNGYFSSAAQQLNVSTNAATGYVITATSSGRLVNPASGVWIADANDVSSAGLTSNDNPVPGVLTFGTAAFGIHACGAKSSVNTDQWVIAGVMSSSPSTAKFSNPWNIGTNAFYNTIASYSGGAVTTDKTNVVYAATVAPNTPAGIYTTTMTYVASATF